MEGRERETRNLLSDTRGNRGNICNRGGIGQKTRERGWRQLSIVILLVIVTSSYSRKTRRPSENVAVGAGAQSLDAWVQSVPTKAMCNLTSMYIHTIHTHTHETALSFSRLMRRFRESNNH